MNNMLLLSEINRDEIVKILANSALPANQAISIINLLNGLGKEATEKVAVVEDALEEAK